MPDLVDADDLLENLGDERMRAEFAAGTNTCATAFRRRWTG
jgi:hypothetical protein